MSAEDHGWLSEYLEGPIASSGEQRLKCPAHGEDHASASVNWNKKVWNCMVCGSGGSLSSLRRAIKNGPTNTKADTADYDPFANLGADVVDMQAHRKAKKEGTYVEPISEAKVLKYHQALLGMRHRLEFLTQDRGLTLETIKERTLGYDEGVDRYTIPLRDDKGILVNIRRYQPDTNEGKMRNAMGHGSPPRLYPMDALEAETIWLVEGELDALINIQHGFPSVSGTHGAKKWEASWAKEFSEKHVLVCYDNDKDGRVGAKKAARSLLPHAASVRIVQVPVTNEHGDISDFWVGGGTAEDLQAAADAGEPLTDRGTDPGLSGADAEAVPVPVQVIGSMDSSSNGKTLSMQVTITGKRNPTYSVPHRVKLLCTMDAGPKCGTCPMNVDYEGEKNLTISPRDVTTLAKFIDANDTQTLELLRKYIGAAKCNRLEREEVENQSIEEIFVTGSIDRRSQDEVDYTQRRIYNVGRHDTKTNTVASVVGTTVPSHKDRRNEFFSWKLQEAVTSLDKFEVTEEMRDRLKVFRPGPNQSPLDKCREIALDLSDNVTGIIGRERLHMAMDLVFHSILHFPLDGKMISRGWLEFLVVGDTRTGKSETAIHLTEHYGLGHVIGCEGATFAGLVGAVKQVADAWTVQWGEITVNDRRLVVLDEVSGLSPDIIGQMSDIRSRGTAQLTKAETAQTKARCRMIWISNPRKGRFIDEKKYDGIDVIEDLIGNPEDIARFDFAMSVSQGDVPNEKINTWERQKVPHVFHGELCRDLILWAWSRTAEQVSWDDDAYKKIYEVAEYLGKMYTDSPPLIQRTNVREKIARMAVALAARTFSTDPTGEYVVVKVEHVRDAMRFLQQLYSYDNFGYLRLSERMRRNARIARANRDRIRKWLLENPRLLDFLIDRRGSFRAQDLEEMAHLHREDVNHSLSILTDAKMIRKEKSQILLEPTLHELLKELERTER